MHRQQYSGAQRGRGGAGRAKRAEHAAMRKGDSGGEPTIENADDVLQTCTPETYNAINQCHPNKSVLKLIKNISLIIKI